MAELVSIQFERLRHHLLDVVAQFVEDPPTTEFQAGYLTGLLDLFDETIDASTSDARVRAARRMIMHRSLLKADGRA